MQGFKSLSDALVACSTFFNGNVASRMASGQVGRPASRAYEVAVASTRGLFAETGWLQAA